MVANSIKILALGVSLVGLVACGKGMGERNNLNVDGNYINQDASNSKIVTAIEIKDGIKTEYIINKSKKHVQIARARLIIKGATIIGTEDIDDECKMLETDLGVTLLNAKIKKTENSLTLIEEGSTTNLVAISQEKMDSLTKELINDLKEEKENGFQEACIDENGRTVVTLKKIKDEPTTLQQDKAKADAEEAAKKEALEEAAATEKKVEKIGPQ